MYWRIQTITPEQLLRQYGVHIALAVSLLVNLLLIFTRPNPGAGALKVLQAQQFDPFARKVVTQLLDSTYFTVEQSMSALMGLTGENELDPPLRKQLMQAGIIPKSLDELKALSRSLAEERRVSAVRIDSVSFAEPTPQKLIPCDIRGMVAFHSAAGSDDPKPFGFRLLMGMTAEQKPIVASLQELR